MVVLKKCSHEVAVEEEFAAVITELANAYQVVLEGGHDMTVAGRKVG